MKAADNSWRRAAHDCGLSDGTDPATTYFPTIWKPNACAVEASYGMIQIADDTPAGIWDFNSGNNVLDLWGSQPPESYTKALTPFIEMNQLMSLPDVSVE